MVRKNEVRDANIDYLVKKVHIPALAMCTMAVTTTTPGPGINFQAGFSFGSPTYVNLPNGSRYGGIRFTAATTQVDYIWRVPSDVDKRQPIHPRILWSSTILGTTPTCTWQIWYQTITAASTMVTSPTTSLQRVIPTGSLNSSASVVGALNLTGRGAITPISTGINAGQTLPDNCEAVHFTMQPTTTTGINMPGLENVFLIGLDLEYTPRNTFGDGSSREGRKTETNLGFGEVGATNDY